MRVRVRTRARWGKKKRVEYLPSKMDRLIAHTTMLWPRQGEDEGEWVYLSGVTVLFCALTHSHSLTRVTGLGNVTLT